MNRDKLFSDYQPPSSTSRSRKPTNKKININNSDSEEDLFQESIRIFNDKKEITDAEQRRKKSLSTFEKYLENKYDIEPEY